MKPFLITILFLSFAFAQNPVGTTLVTATVTDAHGMPYSGGTFSAKPTVPAGTSLNRTTGIMDSTGEFSVSLRPDSWVFTICAKDNVTCFSSTQTISGTTQSLTSALSALAPPYYTNTMASAKVGLGGMTFNDGTNQNTAGGGGGASSFSGLTGTATDAQIPNDITIDHAATATAFSTNGGNCNAGLVPLGVDASGAAEGCFGIAEGDVTSLVADLAAKQATSAKGIANGYAGIDATGKIPIAQIPAGITGTLQYQGVWNATTNSPTITSGVGTTGFFYLVQVAGSTSIDGHNAWAIGDMVLFNGTTWNYIDNTDVVSSVAGRTGAIVLTESDIASLTTDLALKGDASTNTAVSVDNESVLFSGTAGKTLKRSALTGIIKQTVGVQAVATPGTDYVIPSAISCGPDPYYSVKCPTYGAVGDGSTDDANAIQAAINAAIAAGGGTVYFPQGNYKVLATQGTSGANLVINGAGIKLKGCGSANEQAQNAPCARINQTANATLTAPTQGAFTLVSATSCNTAGATIDQHDVTNCHTEGNASDYRKIQQNNSGGVLADASQWLLSYTLTDPYLSPTAETMQSPLTLVTINSNGDDGSLNVLSPDFEGRSMMWNLYICPTSNGTTCSVAAKRYTASNGCRNKYVNHTPTALGCWIGESMYVLTDPTATGGAAPPGSSTLTNSNIILKIENTLSTAVTTGPTIEDLEFNAATNQGGIAIHNHAGQQVRIANVAIKGDSTTTAGAGWTGYMQSGHIAPGGVKFANQTRVSGLDMTKVWHGMRLFPPGSLQAVALDIYTPTVAIGCTVNTAPLPTDNCPTGIDLMGTANISVASGHVDVGGLATNQTGIYLNGNNNLSTSSSGQQAIVNGFRIEGGCQTANCPGTESVGVRGLNTNGINVNFVCTFGTGSICSSVDSTQGGNIFTVDLMPSSNATLFSGTSAGNVVIDVKLATFSASGIRVNPAAFSTLPACAAATSGQQRAVTDSSTVTWGATITGGSSNPVLAYCNGTNWTVGSK